MKQKFSDYSHVKRLGVAVAIGFGITLTIRALMVPKTFGQYGRYRGAAIEEIRSKTPKHVGKADCLGCHEVAGWQGGKHSGMSCESCHQPMGAHAEDQTPENGKTQFEDKTCLRCHEKSDARPPDVIRMVDSKEHHPSHRVNRICSSCHEPHNPTSKPAPRPDD